MKSLVLNCTYRFVERVCKYFSMKIDITVELVFYFV